MSLLNRIAEGSKNPERAEAAMALIIRRRLRDWCSRSAPVGARSRVKILSAGQIRTAINKQRGKS